MEVNGNYQQPMDVNDYLAILRRRRGHLAITFLIILAAAAAAAVLLPPVYRSQATILIERQEIPSDLVSTTVTGYVEERVQALSQRLLTGDRLMQIAQETGYVDVFEGDRRDVVGALREGIEVEMVDVQANTGEGGRAASATVAFTVAFDAPDPAVAKRGAEAVSKLYLDAEREARIAQTEQVSAFLAAEAERLKSQIGELEGRLAEFKQEHVDTLPELAQLNMRLLEQTDDKIERSQENIRQMDERLLRVRSQMAMTQPTVGLTDDQGNRVLSPDERLQVLRAEYVKAQVRYSPSHPDLQRMKKEIRALEAQVGPGDRRAALAMELEVLQEQLAQTKQRYAEAHPDVVRLKRLIASTRDELSEVAARSVSRVAPPERVANNPSYVRLQTEADAITSNLRSEKATLASLQRKRNELEGRLMQTPAVEKDYRAITRDHDNAVKKYQEVTSKLLRARAAEELERTDQAQRFSLVQEPYTPDEPVRPNRLGIFLLGTVLAMGGGLGMVAGAESLDRSVRGGRDVASVFGAPPLATIPDLNEAGKSHGAVGALLRTLLTIAVLIGIGYAAFTAGGEDGWLNQVQAYVQSLAGDR